MSNPNPPAPFGRAPRLLVLLGILGLVGYGVFLARNFSGVAAGADSSGYLNSARLLAAGRLKADLRAPPEFGPEMQLQRTQFQPHGFIPFDKIPGLSPTYAVGLPLHLALAGKLFGWMAAPAVVGVMGALAALILCYGVARECGVGTWLAAAGAVMLAAYPVFIFISIQPLSDTLATTWCLAAVYAALRARRHRAWAVACGAAVAVAVLVRVTNVLLLPALLVLLGWDVRRWLLATLGGLPGALWLGYYNHSIYGNALQTGYVDVSQAFGLVHGWPTILHFALWLALMLPAVLLVLPLAAVARLTGRRQILVALALWFGSITTLYVFYEISHEVWWDLRFILPATPALIVAALLGIEALAERKTEDSARRLHAIAAVVLVLWGSGLGWHWTRHHHLLLTKTYEQAYRDAVQAARAQFPRDALVVAGLVSGTLYYYTDFPVMRYEFVQPAEFARFREQLASTRRPVCAVLFDVEAKDALQEHCRAEWTRIGGVRNIGLWRLAEQTPAQSAPEKK